METTTEPTVRTETTTTEPTPPADKPIELALVSRDRTIVIELTNIGLQIPEDLKFEEWYQLLQTVKWNREKLTIALADVIEFGNKHFSPQKVSESLEQLEFELPFVKSAIAVNSIPIEMRHPELTADHYIELAKADLSKKEKAKWAEIAAKLRLSATQLRISIAAGEVVDTAAARALSTGIITIPGIRQEFDVWLHRVGGLDGVKKMEVDTKQEIYEELEPILEFALKLEENLSGLETEE